MEAQAKKRYDGNELREGNIFLESCVPIERDYCFNMENFFLFYKMVMEKINVKPLFTRFQCSILRSLKVAPY